MKKIFLSRTANPILTDYLKACGYEISYISETARAPSPLNSHPDLYMCEIDDGKIFYGEPERIGCNYPRDAIYNAARVGKYFIHNLACTDPCLRRAAIAAKKELINVKQGYTKCNVAVVGEAAVITSDAGIAKALEATDIDVLRIRNGYVRLAGYPYGFIGGASGKVGDGIIFHGNVAAHPDFEKIAAFVKKHDYRLKYFTEFELEDIGSIIEA